MSTFRQDDTVSEDACLGQPHPFSMSAASADRRHYITSLSTHSRGPSLNAATPAFHLGSPQSCQTQKYNHKALQGLLLLANESKELSENLETEESTAEQHRNVCYNSLKVDKAGIMIGTI